MLLPLLVLGYLIGAVPFGVLVARSRGVDIMAVGSGNIGATNVWRTLGWRPGLAVFLLDLAKGLVPAVIATRVLGDPFGGFMAGAAAVIGHTLSPFIGFKGGKGIATGFGMAIGSVPATAFSAFAVFLAAVALTRYISLGSVLAAVSLLFWGYFYGDSPPLLIAYALMGAFIVYRHRPNLVRLLNGTESKFSLSNKPRQKHQGEEETEC